MTASREARERAAAVGLRDWVHRRLGIYYADSKLEILVLRIGRMLMTEGIASIVELHDLVVNQQRKDLYQPLAQCVSTTHTHFFREPQILEVFRRGILPLLPTHEPIRIWCAAASSGQEPYTLAMILAEEFGLEEAARRFTILATDINGLVLARAEKGVYSRANVDDVPAKLRVKYLRPRGLGQFEVGEGLRRICVFRRLNLKSNPWPFQRRFHVVFCRNVLYYFDPAQQQDVTDRIYDVTAENGWMLTSITESLRNLKTRWATVAPGVHSAGLAPTLDLGELVTATA